MNLIKWVRSWRRKRLLGELAIKGWSTYRVIIIRSWWPLKPQLVIINTGRRSGVFFANRHECRILEEFATSPSYLRYIVKTTLTPVKPQQAGAMKLEELLLIANKHIPWSSNVTMHGLYRGRILSN